MTTSAASGLLAILEGDVLTTFGGPLLNLLTAISTAGADPVKITSAWTQFALSAAIAAPTVLVEIEQQVAAALAAKVQAAIAGAPKA